MNRDEALAHLDVLVAARERLEALLAGRDIATLRERPRNNGWTVMENVRHLLFADQFHLGMYAPGGPLPISPLSWPPDGMRRMKRFAGAIAPEPVDLEAVFREWAATHEMARASLLSSNDPRLFAKLERLPRHTGAHMTVIERLLRRPG